VRKILLISAAAIISTAASAETIYSRPNSVVHVESGVPFKSVIIAQEEQDKEKTSLVSVAAIPDDRNLFLNIKDTDEWTDRRNIFLLNKDGQIVSELTLLITPTGEPMRTLTVYHGGTLAKSMLCGGSSNACLPPVKPKKATAEETTVNRDGSVTHRTEYQ
jgi:hypothetical protein